MFFGSESMIFKCLVGLRTETYEQRRAVLSQLYLVKTLDEFFMEWYKNRSTNEVKADSE